MPVAVLIVLSFLSGSLPFSVWVGRLIIRTDVRRHGDGNPGAMNVLRAGGGPLALAVLLLDVAKGAAPVGWAYHTAGMRGWAMFLVALAPVLGHAFSPFLGLRGGKALAVTLGVWIGLTLWRVPLSACVGVVLWYSLLQPTGWAVMVALAGMLATILVWLPDQLLVATLLGNAVVLGWTHRADLRQRPRLRPWLARRLRHRGG
jgi:glycerol-3-phosphate acyltransferase PlsY